MCGSCFTPSTGLQSGPSILTSEEEALTGTIWMDGVQALGGGTPGKYTNPQFASLCSRPKSRCKSPALLRPLPHAHPCLPRESPGHTCRHPPPPPQAGPHAQLPPSGREARALEDSAGPPDLFSFLKFIIHLFISLHQVLVLACRVFNCST